MGCEPSLPEDSPSQDLDAEPWEAQSLWADVRRDQCGLVLRNHFGWPLQSADVPCYVVDNSEDRRIWVCLVRGLVSRLAAVISLNTRM